MDIKMGAIIGKFKALKKANPDGKIVMLIEESPFIRFIIENELTAMGYAVAPCTDPTDGLLFSKFALLDAIVVSFNWKGGAGWKIFTQLKANLNSLPVLLYTMADRPSLAVKAVVEALEEAFSAKSGCGGWPTAFKKESTILCREYGRRRPHDPIP
jgi:CheY-like chemotaxis protein